MIDAKVNPSGVVTLLTDNEGIRRLRKIGEDVYYVTLDDGSSLKIVLKFERDGIR